MKKFIKRTVLLLLFCLTAYLTVNYRLVAYGFQQLRGQLSIIYNAEPVDKFLKDERFPEEYRKKLLLINEVRAYAIDSLGLKNSKNYTTLYDQKGKPVLWVLTAAPPFSMKPFEWKFPFLGKVSYKGFFEKEKGLKEQKELQDLFYDTDLSPTGGWSTLGFFRDPILSNMLKKSEGTLAELIIHELTHATIYLPGSVEFNENFATFIGEEGAERFLIHRFGKSSKELKDYIYLNEDEEVFGRYMVQACSRLDSLYAALGDEPFREKLQKKYALITEIVTGINKLPLHKPERYRLTFPGDPLPDNTWFLSYKRYRSKQEQMKKELSALNNDLAAYIRSMTGNRQK